MNAAIGSAGVTLGLAASLFGILTLAVGLRRGERGHTLLRLGRSYAWLVLAGVVVAFAAMERALITRDFSLEYVAENGSSTTPAAYNVAALWGALEGSIILWSLVLAGFTVAVVVKFRDRLTDPLVAWATLTMLVVCAFFFGLMAGPANPFRVLAAADIPLDGRGPNPLLQNHPLMVIHPPMLYLGYVGFTVPFAFAVAALITGRLGEGWLAATRRWTLIAWGFLTVGIILGSWWAYEVLGWGGAWAWDPVENASFLPWLTGTAYLHSVMVQERRGMLRVWNLSLLCATFALTILGTFLTRSGVLDSVHSFTESPIGPALLAFFAVVVLVTVGLIGWRGDRLRSPGRIDSPLSREGAFLANNVLFAAFAFVVLLGTLFPLVIEAVNGERITVAGPYFDRMTMPIGLTLLFLMAVAPVLPWRKASGELLRNRLQWPAVAGVVAIVAAVAIGARGLAPLVAFGLGAFAAGAAVRQIALATRASHRAGRGAWRGFVGRSNGGQIVHIGVVLVAVAFAASSAYVSASEFRLAEGESASLAGHTITYLGTETVDLPGRERLEAQVQVDGGQVFEPARTQFRATGQAVSSPSVRVGLDRDVYLTLVRPPESDGDEAVIGLAIQPLVNWLWIGGGVMGLGTLLAAWPGNRRKPAVTPAGAASAGTGTGSDDATTTDDDRSADERQPEPVA